MRSVHESNVTVEPHADRRAEGVWTLAGSGPIINDPDGPATLLVPTEQVLLLAVDLPLSNRARRMEALPFAIEDRIADPIDSVHLSIGEEVGPKRYLVAVVRHEVMAGWVLAAEDAGLAHAAMVPDALSLPKPESDAGWTVELWKQRALVRAADGTGFACDEAMFEPAWQAAGRPNLHSYNDRHPGDLPVTGTVIDSIPLGQRLRKPAIDLRQGLYARRGRPVSNAWRRTAWIVAAGAVAHAGIALADTVALRMIADRREADTRALIQQVAPGTSLQGDIATSVAALLPAGSGPAPQTFIPLVSRLSSALAPLGAINARSVQFQSETLVMDIDGQPGQAARVRGALQNAGIKATVTEATDGSVRISAAAL
ncbi:type II secretion system protein GspL [Sphingomonas sp. HF-S3]|uniref:Type II secretion system protein GspL n=1 Tax=Sphingomonas rustica TaxID=3103142 RepID=A0ABV0BEX0_9SPHN